VDGVTGCLVPAGRPQELAAAVRAYLVDRDLARRHGAAGRERVLREFRPRVLWEATLREYRELLRAAAERRSARGRRVKRALDLPLSAAMLLLALPLMAVVAAAIAVTLGRPVLFRQARPGLRAEPFTLLKFRTMREAVGPDGLPRPDAERLTRLGRLLRRTSLDELPSLWNVVRGDMSVVGPRPLLMRYLPYFASGERRRFDVPPGITGWSQIHGRNATSWDVRLAQDVWYVEHRSLRLDIAILLATPWRVLTGSGVVVDPRSTLANLDEERSRPPAGSSRPAR
jgi:lipopolysaccharide/colanic/teichoic acid biosynthesis glycosyltransferase